MPKTNNNKKKKDPLIGSIKWIESGTIVLDVDGTEKRVVANKQARVEIEGEHKCHIADLRNHDIVQCFGADNEIHTIKVLERETPEQVAERELAEKQPKPDNETGEGSGDKDTDPKVHIGHANDRDLLTAGNDIGEDAVAKQKNRQALTATEDDEPEEIKPVKDEATKKDKPTLESEGLGHLANQPQKNKPVRKPH